MSQHPLMASKTEGNLCKTLEAVGLMWDEIQAWKQAEAGVAWRTEKGFRSSVISPLLDACLQPVSESLRLCLEFTFQASICPFLHHLPVILLVEEQGKAPDYRPSSLVESSRQLLSGSFSH